MKKTGYYLVGRGLFEHPRFEPKAAFSPLEAWLWLIESAAFAPLPVPIMEGRGREIITLQRGQLSYSIRYLARAWRWSPNRVRRFLDGLSDDKFGEE